MPIGPRAVSPWVMSTCSGVIPSRSATIWAIVVSRPWPWGEVPVHTVAVPDAWTRTMADSQKPAWMPTPLGPTARDGRQAADLHVGGEPDAAIDALLAQLLLLGLERVEVDVLEQLVERARVVARVVGDADGHVGREVLRRDEVLAPELEPVHPQLGRHLVHHHLEEVGGLGPPRAADGVRGELVRVDARDVGVDVRDLVTAAGHEGRERRDERREQHLVGAEVGDDADLERRDRPVALGPHLHVVDLVATVVGGLHVLRARLGPAHRPPELAGEPAHERLLAVDLELGAEAPAHVRGDDAQPVLGDPEHPGQQQARDVGDLRRRPHRHLAAAPFGHDRARLDGRAGRAVVDDAPLDDDVGLGEALLDVAAAERPLVGLVRPVVLVDDPGLLAEGLLGVDDDGERVVLDDDVLGRRRSTEYLSVPTTTATGSPTWRTVPEVSGWCSGVLISTPGGAHTMGSGARKSRSSPVKTATTSSRAAAARRVDRRDVRVRLGGAHERGVEHAGHLQVVDVPTPGR